MERYRGRFAPSPTGPLHFGSLVAAAGSFLEARSRGGEWLVRIDDLDSPRVVPGAVDAILRTLEACGMQWDGSVVQQSARHDAYHHAVHELLRQGVAYPCSCSRREIADSAVAGLEGFVYPGTCRSKKWGQVHFPDSARPDTLRKNEPGPSFSWRVRTGGASIAFEDDVQGRVAQDLERDSGDFVLYRADGVYAYQLAAAVDDAEQGITHVVRGADLLVSTPRQIHLQRLLGLPTPRYAHLPVAVNADGEKLSKQTHAAPIDAGNPLPSLAAALAFLGHRPPPGALGAGTGGLWKWALENWTLERVPRVAALPAPE